MIEDLDKLRKYREYLENTENKLLSVFYQNLQQKEVTTMNSGLIGFCDSIQSTGKIELPLRCTKINVLKFKKSLKDKFQH